jgi:hypothetical protein
MKSPPCTRYDGAFQKTAKTAGFPNLNQISKRLYLHGRIVTCYNEKEVHTW